MQHSPIDASIRSDSIVVIGAARTRGRPKGTWIEVLNKYMIFVSVTENMTLNSAESKIWDKRLCCCCCVYININTHTIPYFLSYSMY